MILNIIKEPLRRFRGNFALLVNSTAAIRRRHDSFDLNDVRWLKSAVESIRLIERGMTNAKQFANDLDLLSFTLTGRIDGHVLEFGVASGRTIRHIGTVVGGTVHGFDSFEGLPEDWTPALQKGAFAQSVPDVGEHAKLWIGWFDSTVPQFVASNAGRDGRPISVLHIDCDLYSSTRTALTGLASLIGPGTRIVFDEYFNYPGWREHEFKAFREFCQEKQLTFRYIGYVPSHQQVAVEVTAIGSSTSSAPL